MGMPIRGRLGIAVGAGAAVANRWSGEDSRHSTAGLRAWLGAEDRAPGCSAIERSSKSPSPASARRPSRRKDTRTTRCRGTRDRSSADRSPLEKEKLAGRTGELERRTAVITIRRQLREEKLGDRSRDHCGIMNRAAVRSPRVMLQQGRRSKPNPGWRCIGQICNCRCRTSARGEEAIQFYASGLRILTQESMAGPGSIG